MKIHPIGNFLWLAVLGASLSLASLARADGSMVNDARDLLVQALHATDDDSSGDDPAKLLDSAKGILQHLPPANYHGHRQNAINLINAALFQIKKGDPYQKVHDEINHALEQLDFLHAD
jgi:hypothetical protein